LLEVMVSISVLVIGLSGFLQTIVTTSTMESSSNQSADAIAAARATLERLRVETFNEVFARYNANVNDDPPGGASPGPNFVVDGLTPLADDADGFVGEILFPVAVGGGLREDGFPAEFGASFDLNCDGVVDAFNHAGDYRLLPVIVRIRWQTEKGPAVYELRTVLGGMP